MVLRQGHLAVVVALGMPAAGVAVPSDLVVDGHHGRRRGYAGEVRRSVALWESVPLTKHTGTPEGAVALSARNAGDTALQPEVSALGALPAAFTWRNVSGVSYLTPVRNQHIPTYCGSCWAYASTSSLADRWNIVSYRARGELPNLQLATQHLISCGNDYNQMGTCNGGDDLAVLQYAEVKGIPHESCSNYMAQDTTCKVELGVAGNNRPPCYNCDEAGASSCYAIKHYHKLYAQQGSVGRVSGMESMKREIMASGPISCGIMATDKMEKMYSGGVFSEPTSELDSRINHVVSVFGWGTDDKGNQFWNIRNSWGIEWGEEGYARIVTSTNPGPAGTGNNLIETECTFATPDRFQYQ